MHTDIEALETVCTYYSTHHGCTALRQQKNKVRCLQRRLKKVETELQIAKDANHYWRQACVQWRESYAQISVCVRNLMNALHTQHWL